MSLSNRAAPSKRPTRVVIALIACALLGANAVTGPAPAGAQQPPADLAADTFTRTVVDGWGSAEVGGAWSLTGPASAFSVSGGTGRMVVPNSTGYGANLLGVSALDVDVSAAISIDRVASGGDAYISLLGRRTSAGNDYRIKLRYQPGGNVQALLQRTVNGAEQVIAHTTVPGLAATPDQVINARLYVAGVSPTYLRAKVWAAGDPEPQDWQLTHTDTTTPVTLRAPGTLGVLTWVTGSWNAGHPVISVDDFAASGEPGDPTLWFVPTAEPSRIVLTPGADASSSQAVTWRTDAGTTSGFAYFTEASDVGLQNVRAVTAQTSTPITFPGWGYSSRAHTAVMDGLEPGTEYMYVVGTDPNWSEIHQFSTAGNSGKVEFIGFGDPQPIGDQQNEITQTFTPIARLAYDSVPDAAFSLVVGDLLHIASRDYEWAEWLRAQDPHPASKPIISTRGNHESWGDPGLVQFSNHFEYPRNGPTTTGSVDPLTATIEQLVVDYLDEGAYFIDHDGVRIISLDNNVPEALPNITPANAPPCATDPCPTPTGVFLELQAAWLDQVLDENPHPWSVVTFHRPIFSTSGVNDDPPWRAAWLPIFEAHDVDLVLMGHDQNYARGHLVENETDVPGVVSGPVYIVSVSGPKYVPLAPAGNNAWTNNGARQVTRAAQTATYQHITIDGDTLDYRAVIAAKGPGSTAWGEIGDVLDGFSITKRGGDKVVAEPGAGAPLHYGSDTFARTVVGAWGSAATGGAWTVDGPASAFAVAGGVGRIAGTPSQQRAAYLGGVSATDVNIMADISVDRTPTGFGAAVDLVGRRNDEGDDYRMRVWYRPDGMVSLFFVRTDSGIETTFASTDLTELVVAPGDVLHTRFQVVGTWDRTTLRAQVWRQGTAKPSGWTLGSSVSGKAPALNYPGHAGIAFGVAADWTGQAPVLTVDNFSAGPEAPK